MLWAGLRWSLPFVLCVFLIGLSGSTSSTSNLLLMAFGLIFAGLGLWRQHSGRPLRGADALLYLLGFGVGSGLLMLLGLTMFYGALERSFKF